MKQDWEDMELNRKDILITLFRSIRVWSNFSYKTKANLPIELNLRLQFTVCLIQDGFGVL